MVSVMEKNNTIIPLEKYHNTSSIKDELMECIIEFN